MKGFADLYSEVIKGGFFRNGHCTVCAACVAVCPKDILSLRESLFYFADERTDKIDKKKRKKILEACTNCGFCYAVCPATGFNLEHAHKLQFSNSMGVMGKVINTMAIRASDPIIRENGQSGGAITALLRYMVEKGIVDGIVATVGREDNQWIPVPTVINKGNIQSLEDTQKSRYFPSAMLAGVRDAIKDYGLKKLGVVLLPCQAHGLAKMNSMRATKKYAKKIELTIGVFCFGTYWATEFFPWLKKKYGIVPEQITRMCFEQDSFVITDIGGRRIEANREDTISAIRQSCKLCEDFSNILCDVSIGHIDSPEGWSTALIRTERAKEIIEDAITDGYLESMPIDRELKIISYMADLKYHFHVSKKAFEVDMEAFRKRYPEIESPTLKSLGVLMLEVITKSGISIYSRRTKDIADDIDEDLLAAAISAIMTFTRSVFGRSVQDVNFGDIKVVVESSNALDIIALVRADSPILEDRSILKNIASEIQKIGQIDDANIIDIERVREEVDFAIRQKLVT